MDELSTFTIIEILSDRVQHMENKGMFSLALLTEDKERLVVWGSEDGNTRNINSVASQKPPFFIKCLVSNPESSSAAKYNDNFWVHEDDPLGIVECL